MMRKSLSIQYCCQFSHPHKQSKNNWGTIVSMSHLRYVLRFCNPGKVEPGNGSFSCLSSFVLLAIRSPAPPSQGTRHKETQRHRETPETWDRLQGARQKTRKEHIKSLPTLTLSLGGIAMLASGSYSIIIIWVDIQYYGFVLPCTTQTLYHTTLSYIFIIRTNHTCHAHCLKVLNPNKHFSLKHFVLLLYSL